MANYSLVINSKFKPFSYQELLAPALMATQAHQQLEDAYNEIEAKSSIWDNLTEGSNRAHRIYKEFANELNKQAEDLSKNGLTPTSRQAMLNMRSRYSRDIVPIEQAHARRLEQMKQQADMMTKDPTHLFARRAADISLDKYLENPTLDTLTENYSGELLKQQVAKEAEALAKAARNDPKVRTQLSRLIGYNYETIRQMGFSPEDVQKAILRSEDANPILTGIVDRALASSGISDWNYASNQEKERIWDKALAAASQGLWAAVGQTQYGTVVDDAAKMAAEYNNALNLAREKYKIEHPDKDGLLGTPGIPGTTVPIDFSDTKLASTAMKNKLAEATADYIFSSNNPKLRAIAEEWKDKGGKQAAMKHWAEHGLDGDALGTANKLGLRAYIRNKVTTNDDIINIWGSPYVNNHSKVSGSTAGVVLPPKMTEEQIKLTFGSGSKEKDWKDFDKKVGTSYRVNAVRLADDREAFSNYLRSMIPLLSSNGNVAMYDINSISGNGTYTYGKTKMKYDQLPRKSNGEINYDAINRVLMSNGDYMYYWDNGDGTTTRKVVQRKDLGREAIRDWADTPSAVKEGLELYTEGLIDSESFKEILARAEIAGKSNLFKAYKDTQSVDVTPYKIQ